MSLFLPFSLFGRHALLVYPSYPLPKSVNTGIGGQKFTQGFPVSFINLFHLADIPNNLTSSFLARSHHLKTERKELTMKSSLGPGAQKNSCSMLNRIEKGKETHQFHE